MTALRNPQLARVVSISEVSKRPMNDAKVTEVMTLSTPFDDDGDVISYKWSEIRDRLELGSNVANARWMPEKVMPLFSNLSSPKLLTDKGKPTKFCAQVLFRYKVFCIDEGKDYDIFAHQVRSLYTTDTSTPVVAEILANDDEDDGARNGASSLAIMEQQVGDKADSLEGRIVLALQAKQQADQAQLRYQDLTAKSWEQEVIEDELQRFQQEQEKKKRELDLRAKVRQMLDQGDQSQS